MSAAALQKAKLDPAYLGAGALLEQGSEQGSKAAQLCVAETVGSGRLRLGDKAAVSIMDSLGNSDQNLAVLRIDLFHIGVEAIHIEIIFRQIDQIRAGAELGCKSGAGREPAGVTSHDLDDGGRKRARPC